MNAKPVYPNINLVIDVSPLPSFEETPKYFTFTQNNSGGRFHVDENYGEYVIIAAQNAIKANERAVDIGLYFNGVDDDRDCDCCGDRWSSLYESEQGNDEPLVYDQRPETLLSNDYSLRGTIVVHHSDGTRDTYKKIQEKS